MAREISGLSVTGNPGEQHHPLTYIDVAKEIAGTAGINPEIIGGSTDPEGLDYIVAAFKPGFTREGDSVRGSLYFSLRPEVLVIHSVQSGRSRQVETGRFSAILNDGVTPDHVHQAIDRLSQPRRS